MKKFLSIFLTVLVVFLNFTMIGAYALEDTGALPPDSSDIPNSDDLENPEQQTHEKIVSLKDKTIMIVGNSMVFYGNCVIKGDAGQEDFGYFYQLASKNDENVTVIDHTYSGKKLDYIYEHYLLNLSAKELEKVDYLVLSEGNQVNEDLVGTCEKILALFRDDVEFRFLRQPMMFETDMPSLIEGVEKLREKGYIVVDWGKLVYDIYSGATQLPGATLDFNRCSFMKENLGYRNGQGNVVSAGFSGDRNHQNPLSGYITAQMLYTSITNRSALYNDYNFCFDTLIHPYFDIDEFAKVHYTGPDKTNFPEIFRSPQDMVLLQELIDEYLRLEGRHPLTIQPKVLPTCTQGGLTEGSYCPICEKTIDEQLVVPKETPVSHQPIYLLGSAPTCTQNGKTVGAYCSVCGYTMMHQEEISCFGHSPEQKLICATPDLDGAIQKVCKTCNEVLESQPIPKIADIALSETEYVYNGSVQKPKVTVTDSTGKKLSEGRDYTLTYSNGSIEVKKYKVKVKFIGNYSGNKEFVYKICPGATASFTAKAYLKTVKLSWKKVEKATHYRVYRYDNATKTYVKLIDTKDTSYKVTGLTTGTEYKFRVTALNKTGDKTYYAFKHNYVTTVTRPARVILSSVASKRSNRWL